MGSPEGRSLYDARSEIMLHIQEDLNGKVETKEDVCVLENQAGERAR